MGCYGAFPASSHRARPGGFVVLLAAASAKRRVDLVHTEFLSLHFDLLGDEPDNFVTSTLFADGFIRYGAYPESRVRKGSAPAVSKSSRSTSTFFPIRCRR